MRVMINGTVYDPATVPILLELDPGDKDAIAAMPRDHDLWCVYPTGYPDEKRDALRMPPRARPPLSVVRTDPVDQLPRLPPPEGESGT